MKVWLSGRKLPALFLLVVAVPGTSSCRHAAEVMYEDVFSPPDMVLDVSHIEKDYVPDHRVVDRAVREGKRNGFDLQYVGVVRGPACGDLCLIMREPYADHVYVVFLVRGARIGSWMTFSQLENGS